MCKFHDSSPLRGSRGEGVSVGCMPAARSPQTLLLLDAPQAHNNMHMGLV